MWKIKWKSAHFVLFSKILFEMSFKSRKSRYQFKWKQVYFKVFSGILLEKHDYTISFDA